jgi:hypothetical protein
VNLQSDPRDPKIGQGDWIEHIPIAESQQLRRVRRENLQVYRQLLSVQAEGTFAGQIWADSTALSSAPLATSDEQLASVAADRGEPGPLERGMLCQPKDARRRRMRTLNVEMVR